MIIAFFRVARAVVRWLLACLWLGATIAATAMLFFGNFLVAWQAFILLNYELEALAAVPLIGPIAEALGVGDAQIAATYAAVLTVAMAITVVGATKFGCDSVRLGFDMWQTRRDHKRNPATLVKLCETTVVFAVAAVLAALIVRWDVSLFNLRLEALLQEVDTIQPALAWTPDTAARLGAFLGDFATRSGWGYIAVVLGVAFINEWSFTKAAERWQVLGQEVDSVLSGDTAQVDPVGVPPEPNAILTGEPGYAPVNSENVPEAPPVQTPAPTPATLDSNMAQPSAPQRVPPPPTRGNAVAVEPQAAAAPRGATVTVITGPGERSEVALAEIERNPDEYVRDGSGRIWFTRRYYEAIAHQDTSQQEEQQNA